MEREFISTDLFNLKWQELGQTDDDRRDLENMLMKNPEAGDIMPGTHGLRKVRIPLNGKGTRGGGRVMFIDYVFHEKIYLLTALSKADQVDLTTEQKRAVNKMIDTILEELRKKDSRIIETKK